MPPDPHSNGMDSLVRVVPCDCLGSLYRPSSETLWSAGVCRLPNGDSNLIVVTHTCNFVIYSGEKVVWLAKGPTIPVAVRVAQIGPLEAAIVALDDEGLLSVCFVGTAPPLSVLGLSEGREPDWDRLQSRRKELMNIIRDKGAGSGEPTSHKPERHANVQIRSQVCHTPGRSSCMSTLSPLTDDPRCAAVLRHGQLQHRYL